MAVYLNGKEIARAHLQPGASPTDLAEDYAAADFMELRERAAIPLPEEPTPKGRQRLGHRSPPHAHNASRR